MRTRVEENRDENTGKAEAKPRRIVHANLTLQDSPRKAPLGPQQDPDGR